VLRIFLREGGEADFASDGNLEKGRLFATQASRFPKELGLSEFVGYLSDFAILPTIVATSR
jgi:hypothetical protein